MSTALLGTSRRAVDVAGLPDSVRKLADGIDDPERGLLHSAALLTAYRRAGRLPEREVTMLSAAPEDDRVLIGAAARRRLALFLAGDLRLLPEWLAAVSARGLRIPPELLPDLADLARGRPEWRTPIAAAAGPRGPWLAALRPEWAFLAERADADPSVWQYGTVAQRLAWLADTRVREPAAARDALAAAWSAEPGPVRVQFLTTLRAGLSTEDEPFLEFALDDRAREVRRLAAELLTELPDSALSQRMAARVRPLVSVRDGTLVVGLPADCDESMRRDGVTVAPPAGVGRRAWWLGQLVSAAPLSVWSGREPRAWIRLPVEGTDSRLLGLAWSAAAIRERDMPWLLALLADGPPVALDHIVASLPAPWPPEVADHVLDLLATTQDQRLAAHLADPAATAAPRESLNHPLTHAGPEYGTPPWRRRLVETLIIRREMHAELS